MSDFDFFRHCWLSLKLSKPRLRKFMDQIECTVEGAGKITEIKPSQQKVNQERNNDTQEQPERYRV